MTRITHESLSIRRLTRAEDFDEVVDLQRRIWGCSDLDIDSRVLLIMTSRFAGQVFGAFWDNALVGFSLAFATVAYHFHSHRVGVLPEYQGSGVGFRLKLAQRADALSKGINTIQWTFDPLQPRNAYFNLMRLGCIATAYLPNLYGVTSSPLHQGLPTDRLLIEWRLKSRRVMDAISGIRPEHGAACVQIDLPGTHSYTAAAAQQQLREQFCQYLEDDFVVSSFAASKTKMTYFMEKL